MDQALDDFQIDKSTLKSSGKRIKNKQQNKKKI